MKTRTHKLAIAAAVASIVALSGVALTQPIGAASPAESPTGARAMPDHPMSGQGSPGMGSEPMTKMMQSHGQNMIEMHARHSAQMDGAALAMPGQDAFGAIQEIVRKLEADPKTDWSKVDLEALRQHLIDMSEVTLKADAEAKPIDGGLAIAVTGSGRTLAAIQRMVPAHAQEINGLNGWIAKSTALPNGMLLTVISNDPKAVPRIRGLGFIGILVSGSHHQAHHLAMAKGEFSHAH
jgi:hypothetical protein